MVNKSKTIAQIKKIIQEKIGTGKKGVELAIDLANKLGDNIDAGKYFGIIDDMVENKEIIEIEYTTPAIPDRIKSFYLPKGSKILR